VQVQYHLTLTHWITVLNNGSKERGSEGRHEKEGKKSAQISGSSFERGNLGEIPSRLYFVDTLVG
jgi:hypothetical protein